MLIGYPIRRVKEKNQVKRESEAIQIVWKFVVRGRELPDREVPIDTRIGDFLTEMKMKANQMVYALPLVPREGVEMENIGARIRFDDSFRAYPDFFETGKVSNLLVFDLMGLKKFGQLSEESRFATGIGRNNPSAELRSELTRPPERRTPLEQLRHAAERGDDLAVARILQARDFTEENLLSALEVATSTTRPRIKDVLEQITAPISFEQPRDGHPYLFSSDEFLDDFFRARGGSFARFLYWKITLNRDLDALEVPDEYEEIEDDKLTADGFEGLKEAARVFVLADDPYGFQNLWEMLGEDKDNERLELKEMARQTTEEFGRWQMMMFMVREMEWRFDSELWKKAAELVEGGDYEDDYWEGFSRNLAIEMIGIDSARRAAPRLFQ